MKRLMFFLGLLALPALAADIERVDLRYPNGVAVQWRSAGAPGERSGASTTIVKE